LILHIFFVHLPVSLSAFINIYILSPFTPIFDGVSLLSVKKE